MSYQDLRMMAALRTLVIHSGNNLEKGSHLLLHCGMPKTARSQPFADVHVHRGSAQQSHLQVKIRMMWKPLVFVLTSLLRPAFHCDSS